MRPAVVDETFVGEIKGLVPVYFGEMPKRKYRFSAKGLIEGDELEPLFSVLDEVFPGPKPVQASMFSKYYAMMLTTSVFYAMTFYDRSFRLHPENIFFCTDGDWNPVLVMEDGAVFERGRVDREVWRELVVQHLFTDHLTKVFNSLHRYSRIGLKVLWSNAANYVYWYYQRWIKACKTNEFCRRAQEDFLFITRDAKKEIFGCNPYHNPLIVHFEPFPHPVHSDETVQIRETCCLKHCLKDGTYCSTCPRLSDEERVKMLMDLS